jgi:arsenite methyltransferase
MAVENKLTSDEIKAGVRKHYAQAVSGTSCCGTNSSSSCCGGPSAVSEERLRQLTGFTGYTEEELREVPADAVENAFGCGDPVALAVLQPGQSVLDIGSGAGIDVIMAAKRVGPAGRVTGLDMTPEMILKARENVAKAGLNNIEFKLGDAEDMPLADESVDWVISNCVINLAPDKDKVFSEIFRVLRPGGQVMISDIVTSELPDAVRASLDAWAGCVAGAIEESSYLEKMRSAGLSEVGVVARVSYDSATIEAELLGSECGCGAGQADVEQLRQYGKALDGKVSSIKVYAKKP